MFPGGAAHRWLICYPFIVKYIIVIARCSSNRSLEETRHTRVNYKQAKSEECCPSIKAEGYLLSYCELKVKIRKEKRYFWKASVLCGHSLTPDVTVIMCLRGRTIGSISPPPLPLWSFIADSGHTHAQWYHAWKHLLIILTYFFPAFKWMHALTHSKRFLSLFFLSFFFISSIQEMPTETGQTSHGTKIRERPQPPRNSGEKFLTASQASLLQSAMNTGPVCRPEKRGPLLAHKHKYAPTHTFFMLEQIFHTHWLQPSRPFKSIFCPTARTRTHKRAHTQWSSLITLLKISWMLVM